MGKLLMCIFGGWFGLHKFAEKKVGMGILYLFTGGLVGIGWLADSIKYIVEYVKSRPAAAVKSPDTVPAAEITEEVKPEPVEAKPVEKVEVSAEEFERLRTMCMDIHKEYKDLLKGYSGQSERGKVHTLKECWRKLEVIETTVNKYGCYDEISMYEEYEKIEKKARSFINAYIRDEREDGKENYEIDIMQFSNDLEFISDFIYEKDEKLNKELYG